MTIIEERQKTHGDYYRVAGTAQELKDVMRRGKNWKTLDDTQRETTGSRSLPDRHASDTSDACSSCEEPECGAGKVVIEIPVSTGSALADRLVKEIPWPKGSLAVGVQRGESELIPDGSTELHPGDLVQVLVRGDRAAESKEYLLKLGTEAP